MYEVFEQLLQKHGVTPYKVAKEAGVTQTALSNWKSGRSTPSSKTLQKVADYFGVTVDYLMTGRNEIKEKAPELTARDERDIKKDLDSLREKLANKESGPAAYDGQDIPEEDIDLFLGQVDLMLRRVKIKNKEKYNPNKNKK